MPPPVKPIKYALLLTGIVICMGLAVLLWQRGNASATPGQVFTAALQAGLTQKGITCQVNQSTSSYTSQQILALDLKSKTDLRSVTTLTRQSTKVVTEQLDTAQASYVRYTSLTGTKDPGVINVWTKASQSDDTARLYDNSVLGLCIVPLGSLSTAQVAAVQGQLQNGRAFKTNVAQAKQAQLNGMPVLVYDVSVQPEDYVLLMKRVAKISGLGYLDDVSANQYAQKTAENVQMSIDTKTSKIVKIENKKLQTTITFSDYGKQPKITAPTKTISTETLQKRVQAL